MSKRKTKALLKVILWLSLTAFCVPYGWYEYFTRVVPKIESTSDLLLAFVAGWFLGLWTLAMLITDYLRIEIYMSEE